MKSYLFGTTLLALAASPAFAADSVKFGEGLTATPIVDTRLRFESVEQDNSLKTADAVTLRLRAGGEINTTGGSATLGILAEGEGTLALSNGYNSTTNGKTAYSVVADPQNIEFNRFDIHYRSKAVSLTVGRQRINIDDQRFVGSVGWRQNEQTFDAISATAKIGPVDLNGTYAISERTVFGVDAGPREHFDGNYAFLGAGAPLGPVKLKAFAYLIDYDAGQPVTASSTQTYGLRAIGSFKLGSKTSLNLTASYASQSDYGLNPTDYSVTYFAAEAGLNHGSYGVTGGLEILGSDNGKAFQTPFATLHKFNGWADQYLSTPGNGLRDYYLGASARFPQVKALPGLNAAVTWHYFESDVADQKFGKEWDAQLGFKLAGKFGLLAKYADFASIGAPKYAGNVSTRKFWLQLEYSL